MLLSVAELADLLELRVTRLLSRLLMETLVVLDSSEDALASAGLDVYFSPLPGGLEPMSTSKESEGLSSSILSLSSMECLSSKCAPSTLLGVDTSPSIVENESPSRTAVATIVGRLAKIRSLFTGCVNVLRCLTTADSRSCNCVCATGRPGALWPLLLLLLLHAAPPGVANMAHALARSREGNLSGSSVTHGCCNASAELILSSLFFLSSDKINSLQTSLTFWNLVLIRKSTLQRSVLRSIEATLGPSKGTLEQIRKKRREPLLKQSTFIPYGLPLRTSGAA
mmetsp:Transcript_8704/g.24167  ORF Transcript_8704/g.24167 Transcript_8704/m.24167 type:complete len:282 (-) Transcript_8704:1087-1932(-)